MKQAKEKKKEKKISVLNIFILLIIALFIFYLICFINLTYQISKSEKAQQNDEQSYSSEITEPVLN